MDGTTRHDILLLEEIMVTEPWRFKAYTRERGQAWETIVENLKSIESPKFSANLKPSSVRDRYNLLQRKFKKKEREEEAASGISPEATEIDKLM